MLLLICRQLRPLLDRMPDPIPILLHRLKLLLTPGYMDPGPASMQAMIRESDGPRILSGCFEGMHYADRAWCSMYLPKILGTYERELAETLESFCGNSHDFLIDIGTAEGYYLAGFLYRMPDLRAIGFESAPAARGLLAQTLRRNGLSRRARCKKTCSPELLERALGPTQRPLVICDCEGYELVLLDPAAVPSLHRATILVEVHVANHPEMSQLLVQRFQASHQLFTLHAQPRVLTDLPEAFQKHADWALPGIDEQRQDGRSWIAMYPQSSAGD